MSVGRADAEDVEDGEGEAEMVVECIDAFDEEAKESKESVLIIFGCAVAFPMSQSLARLYPFAMMSCSSLSGSSYDTAKKIAPLSASLPSCTQYLK